MRFAATFTQCREHGNGVVDERRGGIILGDDLGNILYEVVDLATEFGDDRLRSSFALQEASSEAGASLPAMAAATRSKGGGAARRGLAVADVLHRREKFEEGPVTFGRESDESGNERGSLTMGFVIVKRMEHDDRSALAVQGGDVATWNKYLVDKVFAFQKGTAIIGLNGDPAILLIMGTW